MVWKAFVQKCDMLSPDDLLYIWNDVIYNWYISVDIYICIYIYQLIVAASNISSLAKSVTGQLLENLGTPVYAPVHLPGCWISDGLHCGTVSGEGQEGFQ
jgi:hypothetical protein